MLCSPTYNALPLAPYKGTTLGVYSISFHDVIDTKEVDDRDSLGVV